MASQHSETAANTPSEPKLCRMGCGFFGSGATGDCCSKCWNEKQKKEQAASTAPAPTKKDEDVKMCTVIEEKEPAAPMEIDTPSTEEEVKQPVSQTPKKKKKKKANYKNMMAGMMQGGPKDSEKEKEKLRQVTGGGNFTKIDKI